MGEIRAGVGRSVITPRVGAELIGYLNRVSQGVHDDLNVRALVLSDGVLTAALCSAELLWLRDGEVAQVRQAVSSRCGLLAENVLIFTTHTHSGPAPDEVGNWDHPLVDLIADAIVKAYEAQQPARAGAGFGQLFGYNINRRWLNRPADPSVGVIRVDSAAGKPLALLGNYACHGVVLGHDNLLISGDWPGYSSRLLEAELGGNTVVLFSQGGAGDVNPLTETVRQRLAAGHPVSAIGEISSFYGQQSASDPDAWNIGERRGGTFFEAETLARAYNAEVMRVWRAIQTEATAPLWVQRVTVKGALDPDEPPATGLSAEKAQIYGEVLDRSFPMEIMMMGIGPVLLVSQPGEIFSESAIELRKTCQQMGCDFPMLVSYANGNYAYLPPANAFAEGGYEVSWPLSLGISRHTQERIMGAILPVLKQLYGGRTPSVVLPGD